MHKRKMYKNKSTTILYLISTTIKIKCNSKKNKESNTQWYKQSKNIQKYIIMLSHIWKMLLL